MFKRLIVLCLTMLCIMFNLHAQQDEDVEILVQSGGTSVHLAAYSPDGKTIASVSGSTGSGQGTNKVKIWSVETASWVKTIEIELEKNQFAVPYIDFSPDSRFLFVVGGSNVRKGILFNTSDWTEYFSVNAVNVHSFTPVSFSQNGDLMAVAHHKNNYKDVYISIYDLTQKKQIREIHLSGNYNAGVTISPDNKYLLASLSNPNRLEIFYFDSGEKYMDIPLGGDSYPGAPIYSPNGRQFVCGIKIFDAQRFRELRTIPNNWNFMNKYYGNYSPAGNRMGYHAGYLMDSNAGILRIEPIVMGSSGMSFSADGKYTAFAMKNGSIRIRETEIAAIAPVLNASDTSGWAEIQKRRSEFVSELYIFDNDEWVWMTHDGFYNASVQGDRYINVRVGDEAYGIDQYRSIFYKPNIVQARLKGDSSAGGKVTLQQIASYVPSAVNIVSPANNTTTQTPDINLRVTIEDKNLPIQQVKVLVNGRSIGREEMQGFRGSASNGNSRDFSVEETSIKVTGNNKSVNFNFPLTLEPGRNVIEVLAFNGYSWSSRESITVTNNSTGQPTLPNLWILAIGVNKYSNSSIKSLNYCVQDAREFVNTFKKQEGLHYAKVNSLLIADGSAVTPTAANIKQNLKFFSQASPRDVVILFMAGHGVSDTDGNFVFLPSDAAFDNKGNPLAARTLSTAEIMSALDLPCHGLVFIDACHSGGVTNNTRAVNNTHLIRVLMESNAYIFTASRGSEFSYERSELGHGVFTYSILQGLRGEAAPAGNTITMMQLNAFVTRKVREITNNGQNPNGSGLGFEDIILVRNKE